MGNLYQNLGSWGTVATGEWGFLPRQTFQHCYGTIYTTPLFVENVSTFFSFLT